MGCGEIQRMPDPIFQIGVSTDRRMQKHILHSLPPSSIVPTTPLLV
jgi:hypothetical protein